MKIRFIIPALLCLVCNACQKQPTDYEIELAKIDENIARVSAGIGSGAAGNKISEWIYYVYLRASLSGDFEDFRKAEAAINRALEIHGPSETLQLFKANLNFKLHRLDQARANLLELAEISGHSQIEILRADIALQEGQYEKALAAYEKIIVENRSWDNLARLAYYKAKTANPEEADKLYIEAQEKLSVKEMRSFAWLELQRGLLDLDYERYHDALAHYKRANRAYSGYWLIEEHMAEALNLVGETDEAIKLYRAIIDKTQNPEFISALADIIQSADPEAAHSLYIQADELFEKRYRLYPDAARGHYVEYLLQRDDNAPRLLAYAERNYMVRPNAEAKFLLVQTMRKMNNETAARQLMQEILQTPWRTAEIEATARQMELL